jgi:hypothetical protein
MGGLKDALKKGGAGSQTRQDLVNHSSIIRRSLAMSRSRDGQEVKATEDEDGRRG